MSNDRHEYEFTFGQSVNGTEKHQKPTAYDILSCLTTYDVGTFNDFCDNFGYNNLKLSEYPNIKKIYNSVISEYNDLKKLFTDDELEKLSEIN